MEKTLLTSLYTFDLMFSTLSMVLRMLGTKLYVSCTAKPEVCPNHVEFTQNRFLLTNVLSSCLFSRLSYSSAFLSSLQNDLSLCPVVLSVQVVTSCFLILIMPGLVGCLCKLKKIPMQLSLGEN